MTDALTTTIETATEHVAGIADPVERYQAARAVRSQLGTGDRALRLIQQEIIQSLKPTRTWAEVGKMIGVSGSRAEQLASGRKAVRHDPESSPDASPSP
ncbi:hypothetical protein [Streptomyces sp. NPDC058155]|uniref:hypothetical protein n=1 Tax=Streptomyces sp. NPDC058155 TaxID=3346359 RepID=UPI0036E22391